MKKLTTKRIKEIVADYTDTRINISRIDSAIEDMKEYIDHAKYMSNAYFWDSPSSASDRRRYEERYGRSYSFRLFDDSVYSLDIDVRCTCSSIYVSKNYDIKDIKALLKLIQEVLYVISYNKHKSTIEDIDSVIETARSVNDNEELFNRKVWYNKRVVPVLESEINNIEKLETVDTKVAVRRVKDKRVTEDNLNRVITESNNLELFRAITKRRNLSVLSVKLLIESVERFEIADQEILINDISENILLTQLQKDELAIFVNRIAEQKELATIESADSTVEEIEDLATTTEDHDILYKIATESTDVNVLQKVLENDSADLIAYTIAEDKIAELSSAA